MSDVCVNWKGINLIEQEMDPDSLIMTLVSRENLWTYTRTMHITINEEMIFIDFCPSELPYGINLLDQIQRFDHDES